MARKTINQSLLNTEAYQSHARMARFRTWASHTYQDSGARPNTRPNRRLASVL